jgi:hypothetical protein
MKIRCKFDEKSGLLKYLRLGSERSSMPDLKFPNSSELGSCDECNEHVIDDKKRKVCVIFICVLSREPTEVHFASPHASSVPQVTRCVFSPLPPPSPALPALFSFSGINQEGLAVQGRVVPSNCRPWYRSSVIRCVFSPPACPSRLPSLLLRYQPRRPGRRRPGRLKQRQTVLLQHFQVCFLLAASLSLACLPLSAVWLAFETLSGWFLIETLKTVSSSACFPCLTIPVCLLGLPIADQGLKISKNEVISTLSPPPDWRKTLWSKV